MNYLRFVRKQLRNNQQSCSNPILPHSRIIFFILFFLENGDIRIRNEQISQDLLLNFYFILSSILHFDNIWSVGMCHLLLKTEVLTNENSAGHFMAEYIFKCEEERGGEELNTFVDALTLHLNGWDQQNSFTLQLVLEQIKARRNKKKTRRRN